MDMKEEGHGALVGSNRTGDGEEDINVLVADVAVEENEQEIVAADIPTTQEAAAVARIRSINQEAAEELAKEMEAASLID
ncbi:unnamed protein product [Miscanthus lutarioriparius]|uniref:Uncharacterized protein n=1 Tax=Miscanthus lutarioriparius TaxID=422564 RepID=A0A811MLX6_9POAL|nr:unnamed protein product [Miscanthus lutarioriparius]